MGFRERWEKASKGLCVFIKSSDVEVALERAKPWRFKSYDMDKALQDLIQARRTAGQFLECFGLLCDCAAEFGGMADEPTIFFSKRHALDKLVREVEKDMNDDLKEQIVNFQHRFSAEEQGRHNLSNLYMPELRRRCATAILKAVTPDKENELDPEVAKAAEGLDAVLHQARQVLGFHSDGPTLGPEVSGLWRKYELSFPNVHAGCMITFICPLGFPLPRVLVLQGAVVCWVSVSLCLGLGSPLSWHGLGSTLHSLGSGDAPDL